MQRHAPGYYRYRVGEIVVTDGERNAPLDDIFVLNATRELEVMRDAKGQKPRLVHRLDKETAGCLLIAKTRFAATALTGSFRHRSARKIYWALVAGVPKPKQG